MHTRILRSWLWSGLFLISIATLSFADAHPFIIADAQQWQISGSGAEKVKVSVSGDALILHWPGGAGKAIVTAKDQAATTPLLQEGFIRYQGEVNILDDEYGSEFDVQLQPIRQDGKNGAPYFMRPPHYGANGQVRGPAGSMDRLYAPPGQWAKFDFNYKPAANIVAVKPRFELQGNAITVAIHRAVVQTGLTWKRGRPQAHPEPRDFDEKHVDTILAQRAWPQPALIKKPGRVALEVNGRDVFPACYTRGLYYPQYTRYGEFAKAGYNLIRIYAFFGPLSPTHATGICNMWKAKSTFDFSSLEHELKVIANINPNAMVMISARIMPYRAWADENPESIVTNAKGEKLINYGGEYIQYGGKPDYTSNREVEYAPSFYGGSFPADAADAIKHLAGFLQTSPVGKMVIGVDFTGGTDGQLYPWDRDRARGADYSPAGLEGWRNYLKNKYHNDLTQLRSAWKNHGVAFENAGIPSLTDRGYGKSTFMTQSGIDYNLFISDAMADFTLGLGKSLKEGSKNRLLAGVYYSDSGEQGVISHSAMARMENSPYIDMIRSVMRYQTSGSWWRHGKLLWTELDMRPPMPNPMQYYGEGLDYPRDYFNTLLWRNAVTALVDWRGGFYAYDLAESWFNDPQMIESYGKVRAGLQSCLDDSVNISPTIGIFSDEKLPFHLPGTLGYRLTRTSSMGLLRALDRSGVTYARYLMEDALDPNFTLPKICILRLPMAMTPQQSKVLLDRARRSGSIVIWGYAPGELTDGAKNVSGFNAVPSEDLKGHQIVMQKAGDLTEGLAGKFLGIPSPPIGMNESLRWDGNPYVIRPETGDVVLGKYAGTDKAGAVLRSREGLTQIIIGLPGAISPQFIRNLAKQTGVTPFSISNDEMRFGSGILAFYAERGGARKITLPAGMKAAASPTGTEFKPTSNGFTFNIGYSDIAVFQIVKR